MPINRPCSVCPPVSGLFLLVQCSPFSSVLLNMAGLTDFLCLKMLHFREYRAFSISRKEILGLTVLLGLVMVSLKCTGIWVPPKEGIPESFSDILDLSIPSIQLCSTKETSPVFSLQNVSEYFLLFYIWEKGDSEFKDQSLVIQLNAPKTRWTANFVASRLETCTFYSLLCPSTKDYTLKTKITKPMKQNLTLWDCSLSLQMI